jgi:hypothetical protein
MGITAEAPASFRRATLAVAAAIIAFELALFWVASRLMPLPAIQGAEEKNLLVVLVVFWTLLTLQATGAVGLGWLLVAIARTRVSVGEGRLRLEHPWRSWQGTGREVVELYTSPGWLHLRTHGTLRTWHLRGGDRDAALWAALQAIVPADAQLSARDAQRLMIARTLGPWLIALALGVLGFSLLQRWLESLR